MPTLFNKKKAVRGFTLIELLVVISVISLLSSVVFASLNETRKKARDTYRVQTVKEIEKALQLYYSDNGFYPKATFAYMSSGVGCARYLGWPTFEAAISPYIAINWDEFCRVGPSGTALLYDSNSADEYNTYGLLIQPTESSVLRALSANDGGFMSSQYEIGEQPSYCKNKYKDNGPANWYSSFSTVCKGGN